jgi:hypothetical protein
MYIYRTEIKPGKHPDTRINGAFDEMYHVEVQTDLPAAVADRSSYRDRQRHSRNAWTSRFRARHARPPT